MDYNVPIVVVDLPEARVRLVESGRIMLVMPGWDPEFFEDEDQLEARLAYLGRFGPFPHGFLIDHELEQRRSVADARVGQCGTLAGPVEIA